MRKKNTFKSITGRLRKTKDFVRVQGMREVGTTIYNPYIRISTDR